MLSLTSKYFSVELGVHTHGMKDRIKAGVLLDAEASWDSACIGRLPPGVFRAPHQRKYKLRRLCVPGSRH